MEQKDELLEKVEQLTKQVATLTLYLAPPLTGSRRIATAAELAKYLKRPISAVYALQHKGLITAMRMPGSRKLYYDLDTIDATLTNSANL